MLKLKSLESLHKRLNFYKILRKGPIYELKLGPHRVIYIGFEGELMGF